MNADAVEVLDPIPRPEGRGNGFEAAIEQLDPLQRQHIRNTIKKYGGDLSLLPLADEELDGALGLVVTDQGHRRPTVAGLLLLGNETQYFVKVINLAVP